ncbi:MAG: PQQ-binding-like beta-propeller repeat protein [Paludisphaera borealis]|uniref:outer membrane protein assembly factor BamB family protein n=1 Tax=Paludisphaera borealis TaxID=1387353 RepID=UPI0028499E70|nr:PQQ-binding-like beta-propeller repeat protein [Paludisphaera borealis]MDR3621644.1 PQQ-binding-like beta-propeller repeat protein [Paludisphaera borealis]
MSRRLALVLAPLLLGMAGPWVQAQSTVPQDLIPKRTSLARLGLERQWMAVVPVAGSEQILRISRSADLFFVQTNQAMLHVYDAETGRHRWSAQLGEQAPSARPVSSNSYAVFATCANIMLALDRNTGRVIWRANLATIPTSGTACDEEHLLVGLNTGMVNCYRLKQEQEKGPATLLDSPALAWNLQTGGKVLTLPMIAERISLLGSSDGRVFVTLTDEPTPLYRVKTGGPIGEGLGTYGTRMLLIPSADYNLYAVDVLTTKMLWTFPSGAPIEQAPMIAGEDIFVVNTAGNLSVIEPSTGVPRWTLSTHSARLLGTSPTKVYLRTFDNDLLVVDRASGKVVADPAATFQRAGLNLREFDLSFPDRYDDRLYLGTSSGVVVCLREIGLTTPQLLRDPKALPFAHVPPEGVSEKPAAPPAETEPGAVPNADAAPAPEPDADAAPQPK